MKKVLYILVVSLMAINISAQENKSTTTRKNEFGLHAGAVTGLGLSYRHWFGKPGIQVTGIPIKTENTEIYSFAVTALYSFYDRRYFKVFGYLGGHYFHDWEKGDKQPWKDWPNLNDDSHYTDENSSYSKSAFSIGVGPGFAFGSVVRFNLMVGYGFYDITDIFEMYPCGEIGVYYRF